jgi:hypothetical protein
MTTNGVWLANSLDMGYLLGVVSGMVESKN